MQIPHDAVLLRIFIGENDRFVKRRVLKAIIFTDKNSQQNGVVWDLHGCISRSSLYLSFNMVASK